MPGDTCFVFRGKKLKKCLSVVTWCAVHSSQFVESCGGPSLLSELQAVWTRRVNTALWLCPPVQRNAPYEHRQQASRMSKKIVIIEGRCAFEYWDVPVLHVPVHQRRHLYKLSRRRRAHAAQEPRPNTLIKTWELAGNVDVCLWLPTV